MSVFKLTDTYAEDPRWETAGAEAFVTQIAAFCYCVRENLDDGVIPAGAARRLFPLTDPDAAITALVANGLWKVTDTGYEVVDFLDPQVIRRLTPCSARESPR